LIQRNVPSEEKKISFNKNWDCLFNWEHVFLETRRSFLFFKKTRPCILIPHGSIEPLKMVTNPDGSVSLPFTNNEVSTLIKREVGKALMSIKPLKLSMFIVLCLLVGVNIVLSFLVLRGVKFG
jgi:hypothetical protein